MVGMAAGLGSRFGGTKQLAEVGPDGDMIGRTDPWIERMPSGRRVKELPDIRPLLGR